jgi:YD repeat-containing protein
MGRDRDIPTRDRDGTGIKKKYNRDQAGARLEKNTTRDQAGSGMKTHPDLEH